jgi:hypothetical protein
VHVEQRSRDAELPREVTDVRASLTEPRQDAQSLRVAQRGKQL